MIYTVTEEVSGQFEKCDFQYFRISPLKYNLSPP